MSLSVYASFWPLFLGGTDSLSILNSPYRKWSFAALSHLDFGQGPPHRSSYLLQSSPDFECQYYLYFAGQNFSSSSAFVLELHRGVEQMGHMRSAIDCLIAYINSDSAS